MIDSTPSFGILKAVLSRGHNSFTEARPAYGEAHNDMAEQFADQQFVETVVRAIVGHPDDVRTDRTIDERGVLITLHINQEDMGYVIGRQGQTARSIRTLLKIVGAKENARVNLKIHEPEGSRRSFAPREREDRAEATPVDDDIDTSAVDLEI